MHIKDHYISDSALSMQELLYDTIIFSDIMKNNCHWFSYSAILSQ